MPKGKGNPKSEFLQIRVTSQDRTRIDQTAESQHLDTSTWARKVILDAVQRLEDRANAAKAKKREA